LAHKLAIEQFWNVNVKNKKRKKETLQSCQHQTRMASMSLQGYLFGFHQGTDRLTAETRPQKPSYAGPHRKL
jgi:hypothetical protein